MDPCVDLLAPCSSRETSNLISSPQKFGCAAQKSRQLQAHAHPLVAPCPPTPIMASPQVHNGTANGPVTKRQKTQSNGERSSAQLVRQSKIFAPFRVSLCYATSYTLAANLYPTDSRPCISYSCSLHCASTRQDYFPDHNLRRPLPPDI